MSQNFQILRRSQSLGPFPVDALDTMFTQGELRAGDFIRYEGGGEWLPLSKFLELRHQPEPAPESTDDAAPEGDAPGPVPQAGAMVQPVAPELTDDQLTEAERAVIAGGRFVRFQYCWSVLISIKRTSRPVLIPAGKDAFGPAVSNSLVSLVLGWWGLPGPIWAVSTMCHNARGGSDATMETLTSQVGRARAAAACARHVAGATPGAGLRALGPLLALASMILLSTVGWVGYRFAVGERDQKLVGPGAREFEVANHLLIEAKGDTIYGNAPKALELANAFAQGMKAALATTNAPPAQTAPATGLQFSTFCELHADRCIFLMQMPGLQKLGAEARRKIGEDAWRIASEALTDRKAGFTGLRVAVGVRSAGSYDRVLMGRYIREFAPDNTGLRSSSEGPASKTKLFPLFVPLEQLATWAEE